MSVEKVLDYIMILSQAMSGMVVLFSLCESKRFKEKLLSFLIFLLAMIVSKYVIPQQFRSIFTIFSIIFILMIILHKNLKESFVISLINVELIISTIFLLLGTDKSVLQDNIYFVTVINVISSLIIILLCLTNVFKSLINKLKKYLIKHNKLIIYLFIAFFITYLVVAKNMLFSTFSLEAVVNFIILCIFLFLFVILFVSDGKNSQLEEANHQMLNYVTKYEKIITAQGKTNHEFKNQLMVIRGYAQMNSPKLIEYIDSVTADTNRTHSSYLISQLNKFPDGGIKGLLYYKLSIMEDEKISYEINVEVGVKTKLNSLSVDMYKNITKILGVLFDNAIDASKKSKDKKIIINVVKKTNLVTFSIYNTYKGKIDINELGNGFTTKGKGHGYGLRLVKDIIESSNIFKLENLIENEYYVTKLTIKTKNMQTKKKK